MQVSKNVSKPDDVTFNDLPFCSVSRCCNGLLLRMILRNYYCCSLTSSAVP